MLERFLKISLFTTAICFFFTGCDSVKSAIGLKQSKVWLQKANFTALPNANDSSPTRIHIVIAYTDNLAKDLLKLDAKTYFSKETKISTDAGSDLEIFKIDIIPDSKASLNITPSASNGVAALLFARYESKGDHRYNVGADYEIQVDLAKHKLTVTPVQKG